MEKVKKIHIEWKILTHDRRRLALSLAGIAFSVITMFLELGFFNGFNDSQANLPPLYNADLVMMHKSKVNMMKSNRINRAYLYQVAPFDGVTEVIPVYEGNLRLRNPETDMVHRIAIIAFPIGTPPFTIPELKLYQDILKKKNAVLYDSRSRSVYGNIREGMDIELSDSIYKVGGVIKLGPNFARNGYIIMSDTNWLTHTSSRSDQISFGLIRVKPGVDLKDLKARIVSLNPEEIIAMTPGELRERDVRFFTKATPFGIIFGTGLVIGFVIGVMICYQILFNEVTDNLPQYATLKAIGFPNLYVISIVMKIALVLSLLGFFPGLLGGWILYTTIEHFTRINMFLTAGRIALICILTVLMCGFAGGLAVRKVMKADPAELF